VLRRLRVGLHLRQIRFERFRDFRFRHRCSTTIPQNVYASPPLRYV
jgi:hypothetical protein